MKSNNVQFKVDFRDNVYCVTNNSIKKIIERDASRLYLKNIAEFEINEGQLFRNRIFDKTGSLHSLLSSQDILFYSKSLSLQMADLGDKYMSQARGVSDQGKKVLIQQKSGETILSCYNIASKKIESYDL